MLALLRNRRRLILFALESLLAAVLFAAAAVARLGVREGFYPYLPAQALVYAAFVQAALYYSGHYDVGRARGTRATFARVVRALVFASVPLFLLWYAVPSLAAGRGISGGALALTAVVVPALRAAYDGASHGGTLKRRAVILGEGALAEVIARTIAERLTSELDLLGLVSNHSTPTTNLPVLGAYGELADLTHALDVSMIIVACAERRGVLPIDQLLEAKLRGISVEAALAFYERHTQKLYVQELHPSDLIFADAFSERRTTRRLKRLLDVAVSAAGLVLAAPLMLLIAIAIRLESRGPIIYSQTRAGEFGDPFTIYKFRSMRIDAERDGAPQFALKNDPRATRVGRIVRRVRLDELPQLWNVLKGDMSMVGPRPERPEFIEQLAQEVPFFRQRLYVKPGITGHAQVNGGYGATKDDMVDKLQYDLYYIKNYTILFDLSVLLDTVRVVLLGRGSR